jgi:hypothetical protein
MARHVRTKTGWSEGSEHKFAGGNRLLGFIHKVLGSHQCVPESAYCITHERVEDFREPIGFASDKEAETLLRRARMFQ